MLLVIFDIYALMFGPSSTPFQDGNQRILFLFLALTIVLSFSFVCKQRKSFLLRLVLLFASLYSLSVCNAIQGWQPKGLVFLSSCKDSSLISPFLCEARNSLLLSLVPYLLSSVFIKCLARFLRHAMVFLPGFKDRS